MRLHRGLLATGLVVTMVLSLTGVAAGIDESVFLSSYGTFDDPARDDTLAIECLQYGTGEPVAAFTPLGSPDPSFQAPGAGVLNQVRFGRIPADFGGGCSMDPGALEGLGSSGFGFDGATSALAVGEGFELGRFTHFNRTIERGVDTADLTAVFTFDSPGGPVNLTATLNVTLDETSNYPNVCDTSLCTYDVAENATRLRSPGSATRSPRCSSDSSTRPSEVTVRP